MRDYIPLTKTQVTGLELLIKSQKDFITQCLVESALSDELASSWAFDGKGFRRDTKTGE